MENIDEKEIKNFNNFIAKLNEEYLFKTLNKDLGNFLSEKSSKIRSMFMENSVLLRWPENTKTSATYYISDIEEIGKGKSYYFMYAEAAEMLHLHSDQYTWAVFHYDEILEKVKQRVNEYIKLKMNKEEVVKNGIENR